MSWFLNVSNFETGESSFEDQVETVDLLLNGTECAKINYIIFSVFFRDMLVFLLEAQCSQGSFVIYRLIVMGQVRGKAVTLQFPKLIEINLVSPCTLNA